MRAAVHAGQLHQPVPGGIGLYITALVARLPAFGVEPVAFAAGSRPRTIPAAVPWIDLGPPHGSVRYELWHRTRRPVVRIDADVVHAPSLAIPPVRKLPLVVTVHDIAFMRFPDGTTRRGVSFHRRGLEIARREATLVLSPSTFTRGELDTRRIRARRRAARAARREFPAAARSERDRRGRRAVRCPRAILVDGRYRRAAQGLAHDRRRDAAAPDAAARAHARHRRPARVGRCARYRGTRRARDRRAAVARPSTR